MPVRPKRKPFDWLPVWHFLRICCVVALIAGFGYAALVHIKQVPAHAHELGYGSTILDCIYAKPAGSAVALPPAHYRNPYTFTLPSFLLIPALLQCGVKVWAIKLMPLGLAIAALAALFFILHRMFGWAAAAVTLALLVTSPLYTDYTLYALLTSEPLVNSLFIISIYFLARFLEDFDNRIFAYFSLLLGACLSIKLSAGAYYLGGIIAVAALYPRSLELLLYDLRLPRFLAYFSCGALFFIAYNLHDRGASFGLLHDLSAGTANLPTHLSQRFMQLANLVADTNTVLPAAGQPAAFYRTAMLLLTAAGLVANPLLRLLGKNYDEARRIGLLTVFFGVVFIASLFSPGGLAQMHLSLLFPFPQLVVALLFTGLWSLGRRIPDAPLRIGLLSLLVAAGAGLLALRAGNVTRYYAAYDEVAHCFDRNDAVAAEFISTVQDKKLKSVFFLDMNTAEKMHFLGKGKTAGLPSRFFGEPEAMEECTRLLKKKKRFFIVTNFENTPFPSALNGLVTIVNSLEDQGKKLTPKYSFGKKDAPVYTVYEVR
jgi:hypothetical protein